VHAAGYTINTSGSALSKACLLCVHYLLVVCMVYMHNNVDLQILQPLAKTRLTVRVPNGCGGVAWGRRYPRYAFASVLAPLAVPVIVVML
jgi:hypothetical protein